MHCLPKKDTKYVIIKDIRPAVDDHYLLITKNHIKNAKQMKSTQDIEMSLSLDSHLK